MYEGHWTDAEACLLPFERHTNINYNDILFAVRRQATPPPPPPYAHTSSLSLQQRPIPPHPNPCSIFLRL